MTVFLRSTLSILIAAATILFSLANRDTVSVTFSPVHGPIDTPVFLLGLGGLAIGFLIGGIMVWLNGSASRTERRKQRKAIKALEKKLEHADDNHRTSNTKDVMIMPD